jgi:hypothetical protein
MKYLKKYKIFESISKPTNDDYFKLSNILMGDLMDDMDIYSKTDEDFDDEDNLPLNKFWVFNGSNKKDKMGEYILSSDLSDFESIRMLVIFNIPELEIDNIKELLNDEYLGELEEMLGYKVTIDIEEILNDEYQCYFYDIEFKLNEI